MLQSRILPRLTVLHLLSWKVNFLMLHLQSVSWYFCSSTEPSLPGYCQRLSSGVCVFSVMLGTSKEAHCGSLVSVHLLSLTGLSGDVFIFGFRVECFRHRHKSCPLEIHVMTERQQSELLPNGVQAPFRFVTACLNWQCMERDHIRDFILYLLVLFFYSDVQL